ncbi:GRP family sugar transporter [Oceanivirga miroungae]|uniref:Glucose uptake protein GlcU n=1 Tax=Oceanivirga miroungae TaxID=1130046 RepID=A0A6I8MCV3_9FUSO|nr:GRP family sugar transporter [Oceanivirga miroungae]VWL85270.1 Glucose uptake protein GlcU [Oceanivirga miroungae]
MTLLSSAVGIFCGFMWVIGFYYQLKVFSKVGASVAVPLTNGLQLLFASILSLTIFSEIVGLKNIAFLFVYMIILVIGIIFVSKKENNIESKSMDKTLYIDAVISSIAFIVFMSTNKIFSLSSYSLFFPQTIGMSLGALYINKENIKSLVNKKAIMATITGFIWFLANFSMLLSIENFGLGITIAMVQFNIVVSAILSILILKEKKTKKELIYLVLGILCIVYAGVSIALIK